VRFLFVKSIQYGNSVDSAQNEKNRPSGFAIDADWRVDFSYIAIRKSAKLLPRCRDSKHPLLLEFLAKLLQPRSTADDAIIGFFQPFAVVQPCCGVDLKPLKYRWDVTFDITAFTGFELLASLSLKL